MKTYQLLWRIVRYQPWVFLLSALYTAIFFFSRVIFGYIIQTFFNILPTSRHLSFALWALIALLLTTAIAQPSSQSPSVVLMWFSWLRQLL